MKAIVQEEYGSPDDVLRLGDVDKPEVKDDEVLVRVYASAVAGDDWHIARGLPYIVRIITGLRRPKAVAQWRDLAKRRRNSVAGREVAGRVEAVGASVTQFRPGVEVFGWCNGAFAEYAAVSEHQLVAKPARLTFEQAAVVPISALTALQGLRDKGRMTPGQNVLVIGASGGVGTFAVQIAKAFGADVTAVCSGKNTELVRSIGADRVIDYTRKDFAQGDQRYDLILDMVGDRSLSDCRRALRPNGTLVLVGTSGGSTSGHSGSGAPRITTTGRWLMGADRWIKALLLSPFVTQRLRPLTHRNNKQDLETVKELIDTGKVTPVVSATYPLREVPQAIRHFEAGHARGKVAIAMERE